jgi:hypothetical protein
MNNIKQIHEWRKIETAPKDGRVILLFENIDAGCINTGYWSGGNNGEWQSNGCIDDYLTFENPTHWLPLPELPKEENE